MIKHLLFRMLSTIPILIGVSALVFFLMNVVPGDPIAIMQSNFIDPDALERVRREMHLDDPAPIRYVRFLADAARGELGYSYKLRRPVSGVIAAAFPNTIKLAVSAALVSWIIGIIAGLISAVKPNSFVDNALMGLALTGISMPAFWAALVLQYIFGVVLGLLPVAGFESWRHMILPVTVLGWSEAAMVARLTRSSLLEVMRHDYIRTARSKGLSWSSVIRIHALKNSLLPVVTIMAIQVSTLLSGSIVTESVFGIPGIGRVAVSAINNRDMPLLQGVIMFGTFIVIIGNIVADVLYSTLDPRIKYVRE
ncbi:MAG: ABC transporter permease [Synergistaceae bacterium]|jgi:peptide/nickel transport system permease protein|nr:ABC transporter permease [Synergistaceae bacterium]